MRSAIAMQQCCQRYNLAQKPEDLVLLCIGIGYGDVLRIGEDDIYGAEVNAACKLGEDRAQDGEILITGPVARSITLPQGTRLEALNGAPPGTDEAHRLVYR